MRIVTAPGRAARRPANSAPRSASDVRTTVVPTQANKVPPMHLLVLPSWYPTPHEPIPGSFFRDQALAVSNLGPRVGVIAPEVVGLRAFLRRKDAKTAICREDDDGVATSRKTNVALLPKFSRRNAWFWMHAGRKLFDDYVRRAGSPDLIHAHGVFYGGILAHWIRERHGIPYVVTEHNSIFAEGRVRRWMAKKANRAFAAASARLVVSPHLGSTMTAQFPNAFCPWQSIPNTLDALYEKPLDDKPAKDRLDFTFLCVGALRQLKGQELLIAAFARQFRDDRNVALRLVGDGPMAASYRQTTEECGVSDKVTFVGPLGREAVRQEMLSADAVILPTYYDTFGVVVIEALACGTPVIATRGSGPESIVDASNGLLVPPGDIEALAKALSEMRATCGQYDPMALREACLARYSQAAVAHQLAAVYDAILRGRHADGPNRSDPSSNGGN